ncbi:MAG TPA: outer membrane beta-barrel protein [Candidatus Polarisedimenticolaceae bacterium]|nr:outer membrane beta-barrel protein [Candidatus Polarisedimenticolaceae bacterium]
MKAARLLWIGSALVAGAVCVPPAHAAGNIDLFAGQKNLDRDFGDGRSIEEQDALALFFDFGKEHWPVHFAIDLLEGRADVNDNDLDTRIDGSTGEIDVGMRWYPTKGHKVLPHLGGGLGFISGEVDVDNDAAANDISFDDSKLGYWADAGVAFVIGDHFKLGGRVRYSKAKLDNPGGNVTEVDAGGTTWGINAGWTW